MEAQLAQSHRTYAAVQRQLRGAKRILPEPQIISESVGGAHGNHAESSFGSGERLQYLMDSAVASAGDHGVDAVRNCRPDVRSCSVRRIGGRNLYFDSALLKHIAYGFDGREPTMMALPPRLRVME